MHIFRQWRINVCEVILDNEDMVNNSLVGNKVVDCCRIMCVCWNVSSWVWIGGSQINHLELKFVGQAGLVLTFGTHFNVCLSMEVLFFSFFPPFEKVNKTIPNSKAME